MKRDFEFKNAVEIIKQADAIIINDEMVSVVFEEKTIDDEKVISIFFGNMFCYSVRLSDKSTIKFDGQTFEVVDDNKCEWEITPLLKLKKWEEY